MLYYKCIDNLIGGYIVYKDKGLCNTKLWKYSRGLGAGYIGGWTIFFSINCPKQHLKGRPCRFWTLRLGRYYFGWTVNANIIPYCIH